MRNAQGRALTAAIAAVAVLGLAGCQSLDAPDTTEGPDDDTTISVGFVTPLTGPLAAFGEPDEWVVAQMQEWFDANPIEAGGKTYAVDIMLEDSQSSADQAAAAAQRLISNGADVLLAHATPETTVPVSLQCIASEIPCITADTPLEPWGLSVVGGADPGELAGKEPVPWVHHFFWGLGDIATVFQDMWNQVDTNKKVAGLFPNDADGQAWNGAFPGIFEAAGNGYELYAPSLYDPGTTDFTALINSFKAADTQILTGVVPPPDFAAFWQQAQQLGFQPKIVSIGKAIEFPAAIEAIEDPVGLTTEVWWTPTAPFTSNLTGESASELADSYTGATGKQWTVGLGFSEALFEVLQQAVVDAGGIDGAAIDAAVGAMSIDTIVGPLDFTAGPYPNTATSPLVGGQWVAAEDGEFPYDLQVVSNSEAPEIPSVGDVVPMSY